MKQILNILILISLGLMGVSAFAKQDQVKEVKVFRDGSKFVVDLFMENPPSKNSIEVDFIRETIQINMPKIKIKDGKSLTRVADRQIRSIYLYEPSGRISRTRIILNKGIQAARFLHSVDLKRYRNKLRISVEGEGDKALAARAGEEVSVILPIEQMQNSELFKEVKLTAKNTNTLIMPTKLPARETVGQINMPDKASTEKSEAKTMKSKEETSSTAEEEIPLAKSASAKGKEDKVASEVADKAESEIPIFSKFQEKNGQNMPSIQKILISLGVILLTFVLVSFGIKKWGSRKGYPLSTTSIKVISQHFLGPKRSIAIIQVAGESLLVGITEQNISMLKTLSLLSEEVPENAPQSFKGALSHFDRDSSPFIEAGGRHKSIASENQVDQNPAAMSEEENFAMAGLGEIRDRISKRLDGMKQF